jgi:hypothetical protein
LVSFQFLTSSLNLEYAFPGAKTIPWSDISTNPENYYNNSQFVFPLPLNDPSTFVKRPGDLHALASYLAESSYECNPFYFRKYSSLPTSTAEFPSEEGEKSETQSDNTSFMPAPMEMPTDDAARLTSDTTFDTISGAALLAATSSSMSNTASDTMTGATRPTSILLISDSDMSSNPTLPQVLDVARSDVASRTSSIPSFANATLDDPQVLSTNIVELTHNTAPNPPSHITQLSSISNLDINPLATSALPAGDSAAPPSVQKPKGGQKKKVNNRDQVKAAEPSRKSTRVGEKRKEPQSATTESTQPKKKRK